MAIDDTVRELARICEDYLRDKKHLCYFLVFRVDTVEDGRHYVVVNEDAATSFLNYLDSRIPQLGLKSVDFDVCHLDEVFNKYNLRDSRHAEFVDGLKYQTTNEINSRDLVYRGEGLVFVYPAIHNHAPLARGGRIDMSVLKLSDGLETE